MIGSNDLDQLHTENAPAAEAIAEQVGDQVAERLVYRKESTLGCYAATDPVTGKKWQFRGSGDGGWQEIILPA